jgi:hypothetical protein
VIDALIFSRNRPMQLEACLRSLRENAPQIEEPHVIYTSTDVTADAGYRLIDHASLILDGPSFSDTALTVLASLSEYVLLLCDDAITYRPLPAGDPLDGFTDDVLCLSLRLGRNTTYCHPRDLWHDVPAFAERPPFITWRWRDSPEGELFNWQGREGDFGYPYSLDGTIHRRDSLLKWVRDSSTAFTNPNQMEGCVVSSIGQRQDTPPLMASYPLSCQVGLPINTVNQTHGNRFGLEHPVEVAELNRRFLEGERIDFAAMDWTDVHGAHQEMPLVIA